MLYIAYSFEILTGIVTFMHIFYVEALFLPTNANAGTFHPTIIQIPTPESSSISRTSSNLFPNNVPFQRLPAVFSLNTYSPTPSGNFASASGSFASSFGNSALSNANFASPSVNSVSSSSAASSSSVGNYLATAVEDTTNAFTKAVLSIPELKNFFGFRLPGTEADDLFSNIATNILNDFGHQTPATTGKLVGQGASKHDILTLPIYFEATGNTLQKFLLSEGIQAIPDLAEKYASIISNAIKSDNINSIESLYSNIFNGFVTFIESLGFDFVEKVDFITSIFNNELQLVQNV